MAGLEKRPVGVAFQLSSGLACTQGKHLSYIEKFREQKTQVAL